MASRVDARISARRTPPASFEAAVEHHRAGRLEQAAQTYRAVIAREPRHEQAHFLLGSLRLAEARAEQAVELLARAVELNPKQASYLATLGEACRRAERLERAAEALEAALALNPDQAEASFSLGLVARERGDTAGAVTHLTLAADLLPDAFDVQLELAETLAHAGDFVRAVGHYQCALVLRPEAHDALVGLTRSLAALSRADGAIAMGRRAVAAAPGSAVAHYELAKALVAEQRRSDLDTAIAHARRAIELRPDYAEAHFELGCDLIEVGRIPEAIDEFRHALSLSGDRAAHSNVVYLQAFAADTRPEDILREAREWSRVHAEPLAPRIRPHENDHAPERRLRIGYVGAAFRDHCQAFFLVPLLQNHDREHFEIHCYASDDRSDNVTEQLRAHADVWRNVSRLEDVELAELIRSDRVDVLVDLNMHMANARLRAFACKPAPVQITWLAYPGTTGLSTMDYRITDRFLDPPEQDLGVYSERSLVLPDAFWCYDPLQPAPPEVSPLPALTQGSVRFGCLNAFWKINERVIRLWARVLRANASSRLVVHVPAGESRRRFLAHFEGEGIAPERIECVPRRSRRDYLEAYRGIDLCLDTLPYNGHTTSLDAFWMGVPVLTLAGDTVAGRAGLCQATLLGLPELVTRDEDEFVSRALELSGDVGRLSALRGGLRERMRASPLMDGPRFARNMEAAFRRAWRDWCATTAAPRAE